MKKDPFVAQSEITTKVSSALTPALVLAATSMAGGLAGIRFAPEEFQELFVWLTVGGPIIAAMQIVFFTFVDRDRLHSEKFLERKLLISKIEPQLGDAATVIEMNVETIPTTNPKAIGDANV